MKYDVLIKHGNIFGGGTWMQENTDIGILDGKIVEMKKDLDEKEAKEVIDATDKLVSPAFVDAHMHIDKALLAQNDRTTDLLSAINKSAENMSKIYPQMSEKEIYDDIMTRASKIIEMCIKNGTTALKSTVLTGSFWGMTAFKAMVDLKEKYKDACDILNVTPYSEGCEKEWEEAAAKGLIDFIGGCANIAFDEKTGACQYTKDYKKEIDKAFELAVKYDLPIDLHCDESDVPNVDAFLYMIEKTMENQMQDRVSCGHVTALSADGMDPVLADTAIARCAKARVNVASMTSCNLYLMDWKRRGPAPIMKMQEAGVNVSIASDNIRDAFRPFGDGDLIRELLLTAQVHKLGTNWQFFKLMQMITFQPAKNALLPNYGILPGCDADLVILDAPSVTEAILSQVEKDYVLKRGKVVAKAGKLMI